MERARPVVSINASEPTMEGAGVRLRRAFGFYEVPRFDPFLLLDDFRSDTPEHYIKGFPWHPHRGIETITYMLEGNVEHGDSLGHAGTIGPGDVQWMTAGSGIIHQEMPSGDAEGRMWGFQLWANLPAANKMMDPRYRDVKAGDIPVVALPSGAEVRIIAGDLANTRGPVRDVVTSPEYLDVNLPASVSFSHHVPEGHNVFAYVFHGAGVFGPDNGSASDHDVVLFGPGDTVIASAGPVGMRFIMASAMPLGEPVAWRGPIVMNTHEELRQAFVELEEGTFIKHG